MIARRRPCGAAALLPLALALLAAGAAPPAFAQRLPDAARAAAAGRCQHGIIGAGTRLLARRLDVLERCAGGALACLQTRPADGRCPARVGERCRRALDAWAERDVAAFERTVTRRCGPLARADLLGPDGLGFATATAACLAETDVAVVDLPSLARCLAVQHTLAADRLFAVRLPRAGQLLGELDGVAWPLPSAVPDLGGGGGLGDPRGAGKRLVRCTKAVAAAAERLLAAKLRGVGQCARAVLGCVQGSAGAAGAGADDGRAAEDCLSDAAAACDARLARIAADRAALGVAIGRRCGDDGTPFALLQAAAGAHLGGLAAPCAAHGVAPLAGLGDYVECLARQQLCEAEALLLRQVPRAAELGVYAGRPFVGAPCGAEPASLGLVQTLTHAADAADGLDGPRAVAVSPDGRHVYVASYEADAVAAFARDAGRGVLSPVSVRVDGVDGVDGLNGPRGLAVSPDGAHVYVAAARDDAVAVFARDAASGTLAFVARAKNGAGVLDGLNGARGVAVSPDGAHVYVVADPADALAVFARDPASGTLTFVERERQGTDGVRGLEGPYAVAVSADGATVYVAAFDEDAVSVFARDATTGAVTFLERKRDGEGGVEGLEGARALAVAPDGGYVYVAGERAGSLAVFAREAGGRLVPAGVRRHVPGARDGLRRPSSVVVSADGTRLFTASAGDQVLAMYERDAASGGVVLAAGRVLGAGPQRDDPGVIGLAIAPGASHLYAVESKRDLLEACEVFR